MRETIIIGGKPVELKATASTIRRYRAWFNRDLIKDLKLIKQEYESGAEEFSSEVLDVIQGLTYVMARQADPSVPKDIDDWLDQFDIFNVNDFAPDVITLWARSLDAEVEVKSKNL